MKEKLGTVADVTTVRSGAKFVSKSIVLALLGGTLATILVKVTKGSEDAHTVFSKVDI